MEPAKYDLRCTQWSTYGLSEQGTSEPFLFSFSFFLWVVRLNIRPGGKKHDVV